MSQLWKKDEPIIRSLLETDVYKILMMYFIWSYYSSLDVKFKFINRTASISVADHVDIVELQEHLDATAAMKFSEDEIGYLRNWDMFPVQFLRVLGQFELPALTVKKDGNSFSIIAEGNWLHVTLWEIYTLAIISELYGRGVAKAQGISEQTLWKAGVERLEEKIEFFQKHDKLKILQFALRRRFSGPWEEYITERLINETEVITGVSNVYLARKFGVEAQGTNAHELPMAVYALSRHISDMAARTSIYKILEEWQRLFAHKALIMLPDTFGSDRFIAQLPRSIGTTWRGFRQDSGDPIAFGEAVIAYYEARDPINGIDPREKMIIFSDGLNPQKAEEIRKHFEGRIITGFGLGTNFSNDFGLTKSLSLVMKIVEAAGNPAVKLTDNLNKATGDPAEIEEAKRIFGYTNTYSEEIVY